MLAFKKIHHFPFILQLKTWKSIKQYWKNVKSHKGDEKWRKITSKYKCIQFPISQPKSKAKEPSFSRAEIWIHYYLRHCFFYKMLDQA